MITHPKGDDTKTCKVCQRHPVCVNHDRICTPCLDEIDKQRRDETFYGFLDSVVADIVAARDELPFSYVEAVEEDET